MSATAARAPSSKKKAISKTTKGYAASALRDSLSSLVDIVVTDQFNQDILIETKAPTGGTAVTISADDLIQQTQEQLKRQEALLRASANPHRYYDLFSHHLPVTTQHAIWSFRASPDLTGQVLQQEAVTTATQLSRASAVTSATTRIVSGSDVTTATTPLGGGAGITSITTPFYGGGGFAAATMQPGDTGPIVARAQAIMNFEKALAEFDAEEALSSEQQSALEEILNLALEALDADKLRDLIAYRTNNRIRRAFLEVLGGQLAPQALKVEAELQEQFLSSGSAGDRLVAVTSIALRKGPRADVVLRAQEKRETNRLVLSAISAFFRGNENDKAISSAA